MRRRKIKKGDETKVRKKGGRQGDKGEEREENEHKEGKQE